MNLNTAFLLLFGVLIGLNQPTVGDIIAVPEYDIFHLQCGSSTIEIFEANFCANDGDPESCCSDVTQNVVSLCNGNRKCAFGVMIGTFGDPCPGRRKQLEAYYRCHGVSSTSMSALENDPVHLNCGHQVIKISTAYFCNNDEVPDTCCGDVVSVLGNMCNGKNSCSFIADDTTFGDPCIGSQKHLIGNFNCQGARCSTTVHVKKNDTCDTLAKQCSITSYQLRKFNPSLNATCSNLELHQEICCN